MHEAQAKKIESGGEFDIIRGARTMCEGVVILDTFLDPHSRTAKAVDLLGEPSASFSQMVLDSPDGSRPFVSASRASRENQNHGGLRMRTREALEQKRKEMLLHPTVSEVAFLERLKPLGVEFHQQYIIGFYIVDFVFPKKMLIVEIDGKHHQKGEAYKHDVKRTAFLESLGFEVFRIPNKLARTRKIHWIRLKKDKQNNAFSVAVDKARKLADDACAMPVDAITPIRTVKPVRLVKKLG